MLNKVIDTFIPDTPPPGDMTRKHRMDRLQKELVNRGLYVHPVPLIDTRCEWGYFIVAVDDQYVARKAARTHSQGQG